jgi:hypothetical protein
MSVQSIFSNGASGSTSETGKGRAVTGFTQVFAAILSKQLRNTAGQDEGPLGTGGGTTGDVYGAFFDEAIGHALAASPAMKPLNQAIERELDRSLHSSGATHSNLHPSAAEIDKHPIVASDSDTRSVPIQARDAADLDLSSDSRGPLLLPPEPSGMASILPPPPRLEG